MPPRSTTDVATPMREFAGHELALDPVGQAASMARRYVCARLDDLEAAALTDSAELGVSELVTNAVLHARSPLTVTVRRTDSDTIRVEVADRSPLPPQQRRLSIFATTGRGLRLVASVSSDWGVLPLPQVDGPGKTVWFEPTENATALGFDESDWAADITTLI